MNPDFYTNWNCWFVGDFRPSMVKDSVTAVKEILSNIVLNSLKIPPKALLVGPDAHIFGTEGADSLPDKLDGCHVLIILPTCTPELRTHVIERAKSTGIPVVLNTSIHDITECYFVPSAWEKLRKYE